MTAPTGNREINERMDRGERLDRREALHLISDEQLRWIYENPGKTTYRTDPNEMMIVGTGGIGIWERSWRRLALPPGVRYAEESLLEQSETPGRIRAMCLAQDATFHHRKLIQDMSAQFYSISPKGVEQREQMLGGDSPLTPDIREKLDEMDRDMNAQALSYSESHPEDTQARYRVLDQVADDTLDAGQHIIYLGLADNVPAFLRHGRMLSERAQADLRYHVAVEGTDDEVISQATQGATEAERARSHVNLLARICSPEGHGRIARYFLATAYLARWAHDAGDRSMNRLAELGSKHGGCASVVRNLSDQIFGEKMYGAVERATEALNQGNRVDVNQAFRLLEDTEMNLCALAYGWNKKQEREKPGYELIPEREAMLHTVTGEITQGQLADLIAAGMNEPDYLEFYLRAGTNPDWEKTW